MIKLRHQHRCHCNISPFIFEVICIAVCLVITRKCLTPFEPKIRDFGTIDWFRELALDQKRHRKLKENTKDKSATFVTNIKGNFWPIRILLFITSKSGNWFKNLICKNCRFLQFSQICIIKLSSIIYGVWFNSVVCGFFHLTPRGALWRVPIHFE